MIPMITINLLDWREERREQRKQRFFTVLAAVGLVSAGIVGAGWFGYNSAISGQQARNAYLQDEIKLIDKQIEEIKELERVRDNLITRMRIIEQLQQARTEIVHFFDQAVDTLPEGVHLTSLKQSGKGTTIDGVAESNGRVSTYMVNIDDSDWFADPRLVVIKSKSENRRRYADFTLNFKSVTPGKSEEEEYESSFDEEVSR
jgi:type IV pilus assembly protein PilN